MEISWLWQPTLALLAALILAALTGPLLIPVFRKIKFGQTVRDDGPQSHLKKTGTPTMGGVLFLIPAAIVPFLVVEDWKDAIPMVFATLGFGLIGFLDDYLKIRKKSKDGLFPKQKMAGLLIVAVAFTLYVDQVLHIGHDWIVPFLGIDSGLDLQWLFIPATIFYLLAMTNAVNITDGLDGLAGGTTVIVCAFLGFVAGTRLEWSSVRVFAAVLVGGLLGFLIYNLHPAKIFMGDTGALALGGAVASMAIMMKLPLVTAIAGILYVMEALSVMLQVGSYKLRKGKRIFKMAPLHHHFELSGWSETCVVWTFWIITLVGCVLAFLSLRIHLYF